MWDFQVTLWWWRLTIDSLLFKTFYLLFYSNKDYFMLCSLSASLQAGVWNTLPSILFLQSCEDEKCQGICKYIIFGWPIWFSCNVIPHRSIPMCHTYKQYIKGNFISKVKCTKVILIVCNNNVYVICLLLPAWRHSG